MSDPRCPWFRFSLRTLFVLVTVLGCWLGWEVNTIRQRTAWIDQHRERVLFDDPEARASAAYIGQAIFALADAKEAKIPRPLRWLRTLMGDQRVVYVDCEQRDDPELPRLRQLFPEAVCADDGLMPSDNER